MAVLCLMLAACASPAAPTTSSTPLATGTAPATDRPADASFPAEVAGMPVMSVAHALDLLGSGALDGRAAAVAGYYGEEALPCPFPGRYIGPLESWCRAVAFTDTRASAQLCQPEGSNGTSCGMPTGPNLAPFFVTETSGDTSTLLTGGGTSEPVALVLIGHAGDARQWQCTSAAQNACASAFVVDRIAWADGHDVPAIAPQTGDRLTGKVITPRMTLAQVAAATGVGDEDLLTGAALQSGAVATVDPRWNLAGSDLVWLVRSLAPAAPSDSTGLRPETVWLVDDATGRVIDSHPLQLAADYQPARLWQMATAKGVDCCAGDIEAFYRVTSNAGAVKYEGLVPGGASGGQPDGTIFGGGPVAGPPLVLPAGDYAITAWLATLTSGVVGTPQGRCSTQVTLRPLDDTALDAVFPANQPCTFQAAPTPSPGP